MVKVTLRNNKELRRRVLDQDVIQYFGVERWRHLNDDERNVATYAFRNNVVNVSDVTRITGRTWKTCKNMLDRMVKNGLLVFAPGQYTRDAKAHYELPERKSEG